MCADSFSACEDLCYPLIEKFKAPHKYIASNTCLGTLPKATHSQTLWCPKGHVKGTVMKGVN